MSTGTLSPITIQRCKPYDAPIPPQASEIILSMRPATISSFLFNRMEGMRFHEAWVQPWCEGDDPDETVRFNCTFVPNISMLTKPCSGNATLAALTTQLTSTEDKLLRSSLWITLLSTSGTPIVNPMLTLQRLKPSVIKRCLPSLDSAWTNTNIVPNAN